MNIQQLKAANPIETVAARYATLHRAGANYKMLCPFHDDHHPSLSLHVGRQYFKCHACGAGGDVIGLVMGLEKCSFAEAVEKLGQKTTMTVTHPLPPLKRGDEYHRDTIKTDSFFRTLLPAASGNSELTPTWLDFGVGLSPSLVPDAFRSMRSRLIFPIYDADGRLTGFGARRIDNGQQPVTGTDAPKYINSPASALFDKSRTLYGIHRATEAIRRAGFAFVVEGYKDVLAMHAAGHCNTVALCGTALTDGQAEILAGYTSTLHLLLDGDAPGRRAAEKIARERAGRFTIRLSPIPTGEDPDELFRRLGKAGFRTYLRHLTATGCLCARRLLVYCLRYPSAAPLLERMMDDDDMPFAESDYRDLLHFLALRPGESLSGCTPELQVLAGFLRSLEDALFPPLPELPEEPALAPEAVLRSLLTEYYEEKVIAQARILRNRLHATSGSGRPALLLRLHHHFRLLSAITRETERTPAVGERWF